MSYSIKFMLFFLKILNLHCTGETCVIVTIVTNLTKIIYVFGDLDSCATYWYSSLLRPPFQSEPALRQTLSWLWLFPVRFLHDLTCLVNLVTVCGRVFYWFLLPFSCSGCSYQFIKCRVYNIFIRLKLGICFLVVSIWLGNVAHKLQNHNPSCPLTIFDQPSTKKISEYYERYSFILPNHCWRGQLILCQCRGTCTVFDRIWLQTTLTLLCFFLYY